MTVSPNRQYLPAIDHLRAFAATQVLLYHSFELGSAKLAGNESFDGARDWVFSRNPFVALIQEGHSGVSMFIVLSGFILSLGTIDRQVNYPKFIWARVLRLYPLLLVCLGAAVLSKPLGSVSLYTILISAIPLMVAGNLQSVFTTMFWAVAIEFQCYLLFPLVNHLANRLGARLIPALVLGVIALRFGVYWLQGGGSQQSLSYASIFGRFDQFLAGMFLARLQVSGALTKLGPRHLVAAALLVLISLTAYNQMGGAPADGYWKLLWPTYEAAMWAIFIGCYLHSPLNPATSLSRLAARIGEISYSSYMWHFAILSGLIAAGLLIPVTGLPHLDALLSAVVVVLPVTLAVALVSYRVIELPFLRMRPRYVLPPPMTA